LEQLTPHLTAPQRLPRAQAYRDAPAQPTSLEQCACVCGEQVVTERRILARDEVHGANHTYVTCVRCHTERVMPRPSQAEIGHYYPNTYYAYNGAAAQAASLSDRVKRLVYETYYAAPRERAGWIRALRWPLALLLYPLRFRTNLAFRAPSLRRVFEVGAATGTDLLEFKAAGWEVAGCEPSDKACAVAQQRGIALQNCSAESAELAPASVGCVLINNVFEHLHDPAGVLKKAHRALINDGAIVIIVPNHASWAAKQFGAAWPGYDPPRHLWGFTPGSIRELIEQCGFDVDYIAHKAPQRWCWDACIAGTRLPEGAARRQSRLRSLLPAVLVPFGAVLSAFGRGDFIKIVARKRMP
jgi:SAM-dependent methyltransferase